MYLDDEKDLIIDSNGEVQIDDDDLIAWDEILDDTQNTDTVSIKSGNKISEDAVSQDDITVNNADIVENADDGLTEQVEYVTDDDVETQQSDDIQDTDVSADEYSDFVEQPSAVKNENIARKDEKKATKSSNTQMLLLILLFVFLLAACYYSYITYFAENNENDLDAPRVNQQQVSPQDQMQNQDQVAQQNPQDAVQKPDIDIVNEDQLDEIKPDEKKEEEKKMVVDVIPTGRSNPFVPISKYSGDSVQKIKLVSYDKVGILPPPTNSPIADPNITKMLDVSVTGIMYDSQKPTAIINFDGNDYFVQKGDKLDNYTILDITRHYVLITYGKNTFKAFVGYAFKPTSEFDGSAAYSKNYKNRQYHSVSNVENNENSGNNSDSGVRPYQVQIGSMK